MCSRALKKVPRIECSKDKSADIKKIKTATIIGGCVSYVVACDIHALPSVCVKTRTLESTCCARRKSLSNFTHRTHDFDFK